MVRTTNLPCHLGGADDTLTAPPCTHAQYQCTMDHECDCPTILRRRTAVERRLGVDFAQGLPPTSPSRLWLVSRWLAAQVSDWKLLSTNWLHCHGLESARSRLITKQDPLHIHKACGIAAVSNIVIKVVALMFSGERWSSLARVLPDACCLSLERCVLASHRLPV